MVRTLVALLLVVCLGMLLTVGASAQEPPGNQQVQSSAVREIALVVLGLLGGLLVGWGGAFISGWWSSRNLDKRLDHEAEENRLSREEQRQQLTIQLIGQHQMLSDQLEQQAHQYMRDYRQKRVDDLFEMIVALESGVDDYHRALKSDTPADECRVKIERRLLWAAPFVGSTQLREKSRELLGAYATLLYAIKENASDVPEEHHRVITQKVTELATLAEEYIRSG